MHDGASQRESRPKAHKVCPFNSSALKGGSNISSPSRLVAALPPWNEWLGGVLVKAMPKWTMKKGGRKSGDKKKRTRGALLPRRSGNQSHHAWSPPHHR